MCMVSNFQVLKACYKLDEREGLSFFCLLICAGPIGYAINLWLEKLQLRGN
jgi:hypothetical protein